MRRPLFIGALFATCLAVGAAATVWLCATILRLDREQQASREQAAMEEKVRLALWRMDSALGPFIAAESMRPYNLYSAFYPATGAVDAYSNRIAADPVLIPSPLLTFRSPYIRIHFQLDEMGQLTSPQVPDDDQLPLAQANYLAPGELVTAIDTLVELKHLVRYGELLARVKDAGAAPPPIATIASGIPASGGAQASSNMLEMNSRLNNAMVQLKAPALKVTPKHARDGEPDAGAVRAEDPVMVARFSPGASAELPHTGNAGGEVDSTGRAETDESMLGTDGDLEAVLGAFRVRREWKEEPITPLWVGGQLILVRPVRGGGAVRLQGCWLDWIAIESWLLGLCADLLPDAELVAVTEGTADDPQMPGRQLASLPVRLAPGPIGPVLSDASSPVMVYLLVSVTGMLAATLAIAALLWGAVALSERRAQFVSAVTHELRSPLTTFRLYTEMLAGGMVQDESKRHQYFTTLHAEAGRLSHLVENVLAYARLERGRLADRLRNVAASEVLEKVLPRLEQRAAQSSMVLAVDHNAHGVLLRVDPDIVDQILYNLVDNACKYAGAGPDRRIHLSVAPEAHHVCFRVHDHGPGIDPRDARRIFRPFTKSVQEAARSAPGVGLGLGLSRRLARSVHGSLELENTGDGACFVLRIPCLRLE